MIFLSSINCYNFVDSLYSKAFIYYLFGIDGVRDTSNIIISTKDEYNTKSFNNMSLIFIYTCIVNIIDKYKLGTLNNRHSYISNRVNKKIFNKLKIAKVNLHCGIYDFNLNTLMQNYNIRYDVIIKDALNRSVISDYTTIKFGSQSVFEHSICISDFNNDIIASMLMLYDDFISNIPEGV